MGEALLRQKLDKQGLSEKVSVDSAGTASWHEGKLPHKGTRDILDQYGISYEGMTGRQVEQNDFEQFDYIITMDDQNMNDIETSFAMSETTYVAKLMDFVEDPEEVNVPDPYYTGNFDYTYKLISEATDNIVSFIRTKHHLHEGE